MSGKRIFLRSLTISFLVALVASQGICVSEDESAKNIAQKLRETRKNMVHADAQKRKILGSLYLINQRMKKISARKSELTNDMLQAQENVKNVAKLIAALEVQIERQRIHLKRRLRALYKLSGLGYIGVLFSSQSAVELDETLRFLKIVTDNDYQLIQTYRNNVVAYLEQKEHLRQQIEKLVAIEKNIKKQESLLAAEHKEKSKIASQLEKVKLENLNRMRDLRDKGKVLTDEESVKLSELLKPSIFEKKGHLPPPVTGVVVQDFGLVTDEKYKIQLSHKGWRYLTAPRTPVESIFDGKVIYSDVVKGYGHTVVIDHGDHYYTVYAHIARVKVKAGDTLKQGEAFAEAGPLAKGGGDGIYFEIRHFSEPENPTNWISKKELRHAALD